MTIKMDNVKKKRKNEGSKISKKKEKEVNEKKKVMINSIKE